MAKTNKRTVHATSPMDADEQLLFKRCARGDAAARAEIVRTHAPWVIGIAKRYHVSFPSIDMTELVAEGNRGLLEALQRFKPSKNVKFSTYAWFWIVKNVQDYITADTNLINVPRAVMGDLRKVLASFSAETRKGKTPSLPDIARKLDMDVDTMRELLTDRRNLSHPVSLDKYVDEEDPGQTLGDMVEERGEPKLQELLDAATDRVDIKALLACLLPDERKVLRLRFGFEDERHYSLKEAGEKLKLAPSKVRDLESMALMKLKRHIAREGA